MPPTDPELQGLHGLSIYNADAVQLCERVGCFHCERIFPAAQVVKFVSERTSQVKTALCPHCGVDAILPEAPGVIVLSPELLEKMHKHYFGFSRI